MYKLMNVLNNVMESMHNQNQDTYVIMNVNIIQIMVINIVIQFVMIHIHIMLIWIEINVQLIVQKYHLLIIHKDIFVLINVQKIMLIQKVEIFVIILVTIIKLQNNINNVYNNAQRIIISFINIIIDMNVLKNVININIIRWLIIIIYLRIILCQLMYW